MLLFCEIKKSKQDGVFAFVDVRVELPQKENLETGWRDDVRGQVENKLGGDGDRRAMPMVYIFASFFILSLVLILQIKTFQDFYLFI